jgi:hypothetical protein
VRLDEEQPRAAPGEAAGESLAETEAELTIEGKALATDTPSLMDKLVDKIEGRDSDAK